MEVACCVWGSCVPSCCRLGDSRDRRKRLETLVPHPVNYLCGALEQLSSRYHEQTSFRYGKLVAHGHGHRTARQESLCSVALSGVTERTEHLGLSVPRSGSSTFNASYGAGAHYPAALAAKFPARLGLCSHGRSRALAISTGSHNCSKRMTCWWCSDEKATHSVAAHRFSACGADRLFPSFQRANGSPYTSHNITTCKAPKSWISSTPHARTTISGILRSCCAVSGRARVQYFAQGDVG